MSTTRLTLNILVVIGLVTFLASIRAGIDPAANPSSHDVRDQESQELLASQGMDRVAAEPEAEIVMRPPGDALATAPARFVAIGSQTAAAPEALKRQLELALDEGSALVIDGALVSALTEHLEAVLSTRATRPAGGFKLVHVGDEAELQRLLALGRSHGISVQWVPAAEG